MAPIPTCFDLAAGLSKAAEEADISPEEGDFGEPDAEKNSLEGGGRKGVPTCRVGERKMALEEAQSLLKTNGGRSEAERNSRKKRNEARKLRRSKKRKCDAQEQGREDGGVKGVALKRRREMAVAEALTCTGARGEDMKAAEGGWLGSLRNTSSQEESDLQRLLDKGFTLIKWDGRCVKLAYFICWNKPLTHTKEPACAS